MLMAVAGLTLMASGFILLTHPRFRDGWSAQIMGPISIVFFGIAFWFVLSRLLRPRPAVTLRVDGIVDDSSGLAAGFIPWTEIASVHVATINRQRLLCFVLHHPDGLLSQQGAVKRFFMQINMRLVRAPVTIAMDGLTMPGEQLLAEVQERISGKHGAAR